MKIKIYSAISKKVINKEFQTLEELAQFMLDNSKRTFFFACDSEGKLALGVRPIIDDEDNEEPVEDLESDMEKWRGK